MIPRRRVGSGAGDACFEVLLMSIIMSLGCQQAAGFASGAVQETEAALAR